MRGQKRLFWADTPLSDVIDPGSLRFMAFLFHTLNHIVLFGRGLIAGCLKWLNTITLREDTIPLSIALIPDRILSG